MKKAIVLCLLALALCFALCGCSLKDLADFAGFGGFGDFGDENHSGSSSGSGENGGGESKPAPICDGSFTPDKNSDLWKYLCGTWQRVIKSPIWNIETIIISEDGSCTVDGKDYEITFCKESTEDCYQIHVHRDGETEYLLYVSKWKNQEEAYDVVMGIGRYYSHDAVMPIQDTYWNAEQVQEVQITPDNWQEYFELKDELEVHKNAFDEIAWIAVKQRLVLKDAYRLSLWVEHDAAIEFAWTSVSATAQADLEKLTLTRGEVLSSGARVNRIVEIKGRQSDSFILGNDAQYSIEKGQVFNYWTDLEVLRTIGSLYLLK